MVWSIHKTVHTIMYGMWLSRAWIVPHACVKCVSTTSYMKVVRLLGIKLGGITLNLEKQTGKQKGVTWVQKTDNHYQHSYCDSLLAMPIYSAGKKNSVGVDVTYSFHKAWYQINGYCYKLTGVIFHYCMCKSRVVPPCIVLHGLCKSSPSWPFKPLHLKYKTKKREEG